MRLLLHGLSEVHKVLVHDERLLGLLNGQLSESLQDLSDQHVEHLINLDQVKEEQLDDIGEESEFFAEGLMLVD